MQFLKTLFWVLIAVAVALFASRNWFDVTLNLWGDIQADIKAPILMLLLFLIGFLPTFLYYRGKLWAAQRRVTMLEQAPSPAPPPATASEPPAFAPADDPALR